MIIVIKLRINPAYAISLILTYPLAKAIVFGGVAIGIAKHIDEAKQIVANGTKYVVEVSNMPCSNEAMDFFQKNGVILAPSKAVNAGGVATSCLEMSQNSMRLAWPAEEVDAKLKVIMKNIHDNSAKAAEDYGLGYNLVAGANISGFKKIAEAMIAQGVI